MVIIWNELNFWSQNSSKLFLKIQFLPQRKHKSSSLQRSNGCRCLRYVQCTGYSENLSKPELQSVDSMQLQFAEVRVHLFSYVWAVKDESNHETG
jgi:hypothetical protein